VQNVLVGGELPRTLKEMMFTAISQDRACRYCEAAHLACCRMLGIDEESIDRLLSNLDSLAPERTRDIIRFSVKCARDPQGLEEADFEALRGHGLSPSEIVEIVDDNEDAALLLSALLTRAGHEVEVAFDAAECLEVMGQRCPDVAVLDIGLPDMSGHALARELHARLGSQVPFLIALTGYGQPKDREQSRDAGFDRHFVKPVDTDELLETIAARDAREGEGDRPVT